MNHSPYFQKWDNQIIDTNQFDVQKISWEETGFVVSLISYEQQQNKKKDRIHLVWDPSQVISYHVTDETYRPDCWGVDFHREGRLFATRESEYIEIFKKLSPLVPDEVIHFIIIGTDTIVDLLVKSYPEVQNMAI